MLELTGQRHGFLRLAGLTQRGDVYISAAQVRRCELRPGDEVTGPARSHGAASVTAPSCTSTGSTARSHSPGAPEFDALAPIAPERRLALDPDPSDAHARGRPVLALAFGQRALIRAAARSGRTTLLRSLARAAAADERPSDRAADRRAPRGGDGLARGGAGRRVRDRDRGLASVEQVRLAELALERPDAWPRAARTRSGLRLALPARVRRRQRRRGQAPVRLRAQFGRRRLADRGRHGARRRHRRGRGRARRAHHRELADHPRSRAGGGRRLPGDQARRVPDLQRGQLREPAELEAVRRLRAQLADLEPTDAAALLRERIETIPSNAELLASLWRR